MEARVRGDPYDPDDVLEDFDFSFFWQAPFGDESLGLAEPVQSEMASSGRLPRQAGRDHLRRHYQDAELLEDDFDDLMDDYLGIAEFNRALHRHNDPPPPSTASGPARNADQLVGVELREAQQQSGRLPAGEIIDLTAEPDSPIRPVPPPATRNPRRPPGRTSRRHIYHSQRGASTARSGSSALPGSSAPVIDLTMDPPELPAPAPPANLPPQNGTQGDSSPDLVIMDPFHAARSSEPSELIRTLGALFSRRHMTADLLRLPGFGQGPHANPLGDIRLGYHNHAFQRSAPSPKPAAETLPTTRDGFTRDTGNDMVVVCPACNEELAYDPDEPMEVAPAPAKRTRGGAKKSQGEHHFWALKICGHVSTLADCVLIISNMSQVYCQDCFENRRPTLKNGPNGFRYEDADAGTRSSRTLKVFCAVDGCETEVVNKQAWVGIYL
jgi:hypothetical protein